MTKVRIIAGIVVSALEAAVAPTEDIVSGDVIDIPIAVVVLAVGETQDQVFGIEQPIQIGRASCRKRVYVLV